MRWNCQVACRQPFALVALVVATWVSVGLGQSQQEPPAYPVDSRSLVMTLVDEAGGPISDASVSLYACRCLEDRGSHYGWPRRNTATETQLTSKHNGEVNIEYPTRFGVPPDWRTTCEISMSVRHPMFVAESVHVDPRDGDFVHKLKRGCELSLSASDANKNAVPFGVVMAGAGARALWQVDDDGTVRSRGIPDGDWQAMLVSLSDDGAPLFSGVLPIRLRDNQDVRIRNLRLSPGLRIQGRLSDEVPRPVVDGKVLLFSLPKPAGRTSDDEHPSVSWEDVAEVREDGTFEFPSVPRSGQLQFITICKGWLGKDEHSEEKRGGMRIGLVIDQSELNVNDGVCTDLVIPMEPTGTLVVTVKDPDGEPVKNAEIATWPNQYMLKRGSRVIGEEFPSIDRVRRQLEGKPERWFREVEESNHYHQKTDSNGVATLWNIPLGNQERIFVTADGFRMPKEHRDRGMTYQCATTTPTEVEITLVLAEDAMQQARQAEQADSVDTE